MAPAPSTERRTETVDGETFWYDEAAAEAAVAFFAEHLHHTEGEWYGRPFVLQPWQADELIRPVFGWKRADGTRRYRTAYWEVPRKNGKTELAAGVALLLMLGDSEYGGQGYAMAVNEDQAKIVFDKATRMVGMSDTLGGAIEAYRTSLYCPELMASFRPLSARPRGKQGFNPSFGIGDELHEWESGELADAVHKGTAARRQPLEVYITTAGLFGLGFGWEMHDRAAKILAGELIDPYTHVAIYAADPDDDWTAETTWRKANPNFGISVKPEFLRAECAKAQESARLQNDFERFHLNRWTAQTVRWLRMNDWDACAGEVEWRELEVHLAGRRCYSAVDLSTKVDLTALVHAFEPESDGEPWWLLPRLFMPEDNIHRAVERARVDYARWARAGAIATTPGNVIDYGFIEQQLLADAARFEIASIGYDPWNATQFAIRMQEEGLPMVEVRQGAKTLGEPTKALEALVVAHRLRHGGHPVLRWMAGNVAVRTDPNGNITPDKQRSTEKIDGIVAAIMAIGRGITTPRSTVRMIEYKPGQMFAAA